MKACCKITATRPQTMECLHPADVGAIIDRPRATNSRPYGFYRTFFAFCNMPCLFSHSAIGSQCRIRGLVTFHLPKPNPFCETFHQRFKRGPLLCVQRTVALVQQHGQGLLRGNPLNLVLLSPFQDADSLQGKSNTFLVFSYSFIVK